MSAWIVSKEHIDVMLRAGFQYGVGGWHGHLAWRADAGENEYRELTPESADEVGRMLWRENLRSIHACYPDTLDNGDYPGPVSFEAEEVETYTYTSPRIGPLTPGEVFKAVGCFDYQSCETPDWTDSEAFRYCEALKESVVGSLYEGPWGWDADEIAKRKDQVPA